MFLVGALFVDDDDDDDITSQRISPSQYPTTATLSLMKILRSLVQIVEGLAWLAVVGAVVVLVHQEMMGETMDGMSGIDVAKCRSRQSFATILRVNIVDGR